MTSKNICVVTGARSEYGILQLLLKKIIKSEKLKLSLIVTGIHLLEKYGKTINKIREDNIPITKIVQMYEENDSNLDYLGKAVGKAVIGFTEAFIEIKPDLILVLGDRYEPFTAVVSASTLSIPIAHIHGGDNIHKGQIDEQIRHSITKFAHIHFPATSKSSERIKLLGEEEWRIHMVGSPSIDMIFKEELLNKEQICKKLGLDFSKKIILCLQHPYTFLSELAGEQMKLTLNVLKDLNLQTVIIYPNNDRGSDLIVREIEKNKSVPYFKIFKDLKRTDYLSLLKNVDLFVGNSSSGLIESPIFKLPVVNIGNRNKGRESAENVINVLHNYKEIINAIKKGLSNDFKKICQNVRNPYGDGKASKRIVKILENLEINKEFLIKKLTFKI
ncbi:MAG: UDP-N-acetylglucosamine 2-epimerase [Promethearchaeota archaeon]